MVEKEYTFISSGGRLTLYDGLLHEAINDTIVVMCHICMDEESITVHDRFSIVGDTSRCFHCNQQKVFI